MRRFQGDEGRNLAQVQPVWYVAYGSNLCRQRFLHYLHGGRPPGSRRHYPGSRDRTEPRADTALTIPGRVRFVGESRVWGGGLAVYDPDAVGEVAARAYLISAAQFADVFAQETRTEPGLDLDLTRVREHGRHALGPGPYQTLAQVGVRDELPMLTFTGSHLDELTDHPPSPGYLRHITTGLAESHGWSADRIRRYLGGFTARRV